MTETDSNNKRWLNALLDAEDAARFDTIQHHHGIQSKSDIVRYLIRQEARRIASQTQEVPS